MGILDWWRARGSSAAGILDRQAVDETLERVVQLTNPKLKFAKRYRARLAPGIEATIVHARSLVASVTEVRSANAAAWASDPYIQAFFATADDLVQIFSRSVELRALFAQDPGLQEAHVVIGMKMTERQVLGTAMEGDRVRGEVAQTTVSFGDHRVRIVGRTESELRAEVERRLVDQVALEGLAMMAAAQSSRKDLEQERAVLRARLQMLERKGAGMRGALGAEATGQVAGQAELARLQQKLDENTADLAGAGGGAQVLDRELGQLLGVLAEPAQKLFVTSKRMRINQLNVVVGEGGTEFEFLVARIPGTTPPEMRAFSFARFPRAELLTQDRLIGDAARLLG